MKLSQLMTLIVYGAVASATLTPTVRLVEFGAISWPFALLMAAVAIPLVFSLITFPLVRTGPLKDWLVRSLLLTSVSVILGAASYSLVWAATGPPALNVWANSAMRVEFVWAVIVVLAVPFAHLFGLVVPRWCPRCQVPALLPDSAGGTDSMSKQQRGYWCPSCDGRFRRVQGSWRAIPSKPSPSRCVCHGLDPGRGEQ